MEYSDIDRVEAIRALYKELLDREADEPGLQHYYGSEYSVEQIRKILDASEERKAVLKRQKNEGCEYDYVEPGIAFGSEIYLNDIAILKKAGFNAILDLNQSTPEISASIEAEFERTLKIKLPANVVISVSDTKKILKFIADCKADGFTVLVSHGNGSTLSPAMAILWFISQGFDREQAVVFVSSCVRNADVDKALLGPWHIKAAETMFRS